MAHNINKVLTSALGTATGFVHLNKPDYGNEELGFGNPRGVWKVDLTVANKQAQPMIDQLTAIHEAAYAEAVAAFEENPPKRVPGKKPPLQPYEGDMPWFDNGDGTTTFKFKCYASYQDKKTQETKHITVTIVDAKGKRIAELPIIGSGSKLKVKFKAIPYKWNTAVGASLKLQLESVMLVELATYGGGEGDDWADDIEEGGYEAQESKGSRDERQWQEPEDQESDGDAEGDDGDF